jgi:hypothetical protein
LAQEAFLDSKTLTGKQFDTVAWEAVYDGLHATPRMFQMWDCKQVWNMAGQITRMLNGMKQ